MNKYEENVWYGWNGGECPVHPKTTVNVVFNDIQSLDDETQASKFSWNHEGCGDIVAFRVVKEYKEPREFWISENDLYAHGSLDSALSDHLTVKHGYIHVREVTDE